MPGKESGESLLNTAQSAAMVDASEHLLQHGRDLAYSSHTSVAPGAKGETNVTVTDAAGNPKQFIEKNSSKGSAWDNTTLSLVYDSAGHLQRKTETSIKAEHGMFAIFDSTVHASMQQRTSDAQGKLQWRIDAQCTVTDQKNQDYDCNGTLYDGVNRILGQAHIVKKGQDAFMEIVKPDGQPAGRIDTITKLDNGGTTAVTSARIG